MYSLAQLIDERCNGGCFLTYVLTCTYIYTRIHAYLPVLVEEGPQVWKFHPMG